METRERIEAEKGDADALREIDESNRRQMSECIERLGVLFDDEANLNEVC